MFKKEKQFEKFFLKVSALLKAIVRELCLWIFSSVFSFCKMKGHYWWKYETTHHVSGVSVAEKITKSTISHNFSKWRHRYCFFFFFCRCFVSLVRFSYWFKFPASNFTGSRVITIFVYKVFQQKLTNQKYPCLSFFFQYLDTALT